MRLARRDNVLDVALTRRPEAGARVGPVDRSQRPDDVVLDGLGVGVVAFALVGRAPVLGGDGETAPGFRRRASGKYRQDDSGGQPRCLEKVRSPLADVVFSTIDGWQHLRRCYPSQSSPGIVSSVSS